MNSKIFYLLTVLVLSLSGLTASNTQSTIVPSQTPIPSETALPSATSTHKPLSDFFYTLPTHLIGETVVEGDYIINLEKALLDGEQLKIVLNLTNLSQHEIDLVLALQLFLENQLILPKHVFPRYLPAGQTMQYEQVYMLTGKPNLPSALINYHLLYAPFGWSGPVIIYRLTDQIPNDGSPVESIPRPAAYNGVTGDPWKVLVLIYKNIDTDYVDIDNITKHLTASMPLQDQNNMRTSFLNLPNKSVVYDYSDHTAEMYAHIVFVERPLTDLEPIGTGYWPSPAVTQPELDQYAPDGTFDSVIVFWQASHPNTGQSIPIISWGLGYWPGSYANGMTYATVLNISYVWPGDDGEVFLHEWLHGVESFYTSLGFRFPIGGLHGAGEHGYVDENGHWHAWLRDFMRGLVYENGVRTGLIPETWQGGSITTFNISNWRGEYFNNETLNDIPIVIRDDPEINFTWDLSSPHLLINNDHFSSRWTRDIFFGGGTYHFDILRDGGIRLKIDDTTILEKWSNGVGLESVDYVLPYGTHNIQVEYYEIDGAAAISFSYYNIAPTFSDVSDEYWAWEFIQILYGTGLTSGCSTNPLAYCPERSVTRAEMAIFIERGIHSAAYIPPSGTGGVFADVPLSYWAADWIEKLYADGITSGCGTSPLVYCPEASVTRDQMAVFLLKAKYGANYNPPAAVGIFTDVPTSHWAASWIEQLYAERITGGCNLSPLSYCPENQVTRAEMAVFLVKTFNLAAYNLLVNGGFEDGSGSPSGWNSDAFIPDVTFTWDNAQAHSGARSVKIASTLPNDSRWIQRLIVQPNTEYRLSGWIKTEDVAHTQQSVDAGANLSLFEPTSFTYSGGLIGTNDWTFVTLSFNSGSNTQIAVACRLGMWSGTTTGVAWFDDLRLEEVNSNTYDIQDPGFESSVSGHPDN